MVKRKINGSTVFLAVMAVTFGLGVVSSGAAELKVGYVDLRRAFYEYQKAKDLETQLSSLTGDRQDERNKKVDEVTRLRDELALLAGEAKAKKEKEIEEKLAKLQEYDKEIRQELLTKKNDMFREVIEDIQKVVESIGQAEGYDYVFDSRNIMYSKETYDLTNEVLKKLNNK